MIRTSPADADRFFALPARAHAADPLWVHPEYGLHRRLLRGTSVFRRRADAAAWVVRDAAEAAAFRDPRYGDTGLVGLVEALPGAERELAEALRSAEAWLRERGARRALVPVNGHVLYGFGFLETGHDRPPVVGTQRTPPWYLEVVRSCGYRDGRRFHTYAVPLQGRALEVARAAPLPHGIRLRRVTRLRFRRPILAMAELRNRTFTHLYGDAPMYPEEAWELLRRLRPVLVPDFALVAEADGVPVGFVLAFPDFNQAFAPLRAEPRGPRAALALARARITRGGLGEVGVLQTHRGRGLATALVARVVLAMARRGYRELHYLLVQEDNEASRRTVERFGGEVVSTHVVLQKDL